jgi:hypothetical protein
MQIGKDQSRADDSDRHNKRHKRRPTFEPRLPPVGLTHKAHLADENGDHRVSAGYAEAADK